MRYCKQCLFQIMLGNKRTTYTLVFIDLVTLPTDINIAPYVTRTSPYASLLPALDVLTVLLTPRTRSYPPIPLNQHARRPAKNIPTMAAPNIPTTTAALQRPQSHQHLNKK